MTHVHRFSFTERVVHWIVGVTFVLLLLSGLAFSYPSLYWLTLFFGGGPAARVLHPWIGIVFTVGIAAMFFIWLHDMSMTGDDMRWLRAIKHYARHDRDRVPPAGKYNGGQKLFFWVQSALGVAFLVTGVLLWFPDGIVGSPPLGRGLLSLMRLLHYVAALGGGLLLIIHIYLGTVAYPGTARAMLRGTVTPEWAKLHHPGWQHDETRS